MGRDTTLTQLAAELSEGRTTPFGAYVFAAGDPRSQLARSVEASVFDEVFGNSPELLAAEYDPYEAATVFTCIIDHRKARPAAAKRLILPSPAGFKSLDDIERGPWRQPVSEVLARSRVELDWGRTLDLATVAVAPEYRGARTNGLVSLALNQVTSRLSVLHGLRWWVTIVDVNVLDLYQHGLGVPVGFYDGLEPLGYLDSPLSVPVYCDIEGWRSHLARTDPSLYAVLVDGTGLTDAVAHFDLDEARRVLRGAGYDVSDQAAAA